MGKGVFRLRVTFPHRAGIRLPSPVRHLPTSCYQIYRHLRKIRRCAGSWFASRYRPPAGRLRFADTCIRNATDSGLLSAKSPAIVPLKKGEAHEEDAPDDCGSARWSRVPPSRPICAAGAGLPRPAPPVPVTSAGAVATSAVTSAACGPEGLVDATWVRPLAFTSAATMRTIGSAGVQAGCNYQVGAFVFGSARRLRLDRCEGLAYVATVRGSQQHSRIRSLASVTGRIGYAWDRFLGYVKGGGAWERDGYDIRPGGGHGGHGTRDAPRLDGRHRR